MTYQDFRTRYHFSISEKDLLGGGQFGQVYKAWDMVENEEVAIKISPVKNLDSKLTLKNEVELGKNLPRHKNIIRYQECYRFELENGICDYGIMKYYADGNLLTLINQKKLSIDQKKQIARGIIDGIHHIHQNQLIHRDLKPSNIIISRYGDQYIPLLADFGLGKFTKAKQNDIIENSIAGGTVAYASPEQLVGDDLLYNSDLWSFGVILYQLFLNQLPFGEGDKSVLSNAVKMYKTILSVKQPLGLDNITQPFDEICRKCLIIDTNQRISSSFKILNILGENNFETVVETKFLNKNKNTSSGEKENINNKIKGIFPYVKILFILITGLLLVFFLFKSRVSKNDQRDKNVEKKENVVPNDKDNNIDDGQGKKEPNNTNNKGTVKYPNSMKKAKLDDILKTILSDVNSQNDKFKLLEEYKSVLDDQVASDCIIEDNGLLEPSGLNGIILKAIVENKKLIIKNSAFDSNGKYKYISF